SACLAGWACGQLRAGTRARHRVLERWDVSLGPTGLLGIAGLAVLYSLFMPLFSRRYWVLLALSLFVAISAGYLPLRQFISYRIFHWGYESIFANWVCAGVYVLTLFEMLRVIVSALRKHLPGAGIVAAGFAAFFVSHAT